MRSIVALHGVLDFNIRFASATFLLCGGIALGLITLVSMPSRDLIIDRVGNARPNLVLPVAKYASKGHSRGTIEVSLNRKGDWVTAHGEQAEVPDLPAFLRERGKRIREAGYTPGLRVRIAADAPARHLREAAMAAEREGYGELRVACVSP